MNNVVTLKIELPKIPDIELVALEGLDRLGRHMGIAEDKIGEARVLVTEAIINALEHTGEQHPIVHVEFTISKNELTIFVRDYGTGFVLDAVAVPDIKTKLTSDQKRGWGLHLMKSMSDDFRVESNETGTKITLIKKFT
jgi:anti-sigma regulatory factor (Ser/Thr protein kinase)